MKRLTSIPKDEAKDAFGFSARVQSSFNDLNKEFKDNCFTIKRIELFSSENDRKEKAVVFSYSFKTNERTGRLDIKRCKELNIPVGPILKKLKDGEDIELEDGRIIRNSDCCSPPIPGDEFLIIDCPSSGYLNSLKENEYLNYIIDKKDTQLKYVFHLSDISMILDKDYQEWANRFSPQVEHIGLNEYCSNLSFLANHEQIYHYNKFDQDLCKQLYYSDEPIELPFESRIRPAKLLEVFNFGIKKDLGKKYQPISIDYKKLNHELENVKNIDKAIKEYKRKTESIKNEMVYPSITFTGTAAAAPGKYRNCSGIFISLNENDNCILDCGEGTLDSIVRLYGPKKYLKKLSKLKFIYSSHSHTDHHIGLINLLIHYRRSIKNLKINQKLKIFITEGVNKFLDFYDLNFEPIKDLYEVQLHPTNGTFYLPKEDAKKMGLTEFVITMVPHSYQSTGIAITVDRKENDFKIAYSGDCLPTDSLVEIGKNCDLLINEATFSEDLMDEALRKAHTTTEQAIEQRNKMNAKFLLLTHFSQRYAKLPLPSDKYDNRVGVAFDYLTVNPSTLKKTAYFKSLLEVFYKKDLDELSSTIEKRKNKKTNE